MRNDRALRRVGREGRVGMPAIDGHRALLVSEGLHPSAPADIAALLVTLSAELAAVWSAPTAQAILSAAAPRFEIAGDG